MLAPGSAGVHPENLYKAAASMASLNMDFPPISPTILQKHLEDGAAM
jgi:hypothetical protein